MRLNRPRWIFLIAVIIFLFPVVGLAQQAAPLLIIYGQPDSTSNPPEVQTRISVIDDTGRFMEGLTEANFTLQEAGADIPNFTVRNQEEGLAIAIVIDRGGINAPGDSRIQDVNSLTRELISMLTIESNADNDDMLAIIGIDENGAGNPEKNFTYKPVDTNLMDDGIRLIEEDTDGVKGGTPLYEGLDRAIALLTDNPERHIYDALSTRRKIILVFSDGIDPNYSNEAREGDIIDAAEENDITIYAIGMARQNGSLNKEANLIRLSTQTQGTYQLHNNDETHQLVLDLFANLTTQRNQYMLYHDTHLPAGKHDLTVIVETEGGFDEAEIDFSSNLKLPQMRLTSPANNSQFTVPYSKTLKGFVPMQINFSVNIEPASGIGRVQPPREVRYFINGQQVGTGGAPDFNFAWMVSSWISPTVNGKVENLTLTADAIDPDLNQSYSSIEAVNINVTWNAVEGGITDIISGGPESVDKETKLPFWLWIRQNWWLVMIIFALVIGLIWLLLMLLQTRSQLAKKIVKGATGVLKGMTRPLSEGFKQAPGKLVIQQGANIGREFRLAARMVKVGREPQYSDLALYDEFASNPHFSIQLDGTDFYITDLGSRNGTRVNSTPLQPNDRTLLEPDAIIEVGNTRLQFKALGNTTTPFNSN